MTYETVIQRLRFRMRDVKNVPLLYYENGALFTVVNEGARELYRKTRDFEKEADLTIVTDQYDYDISSEIATDVGEIHDIIMATGSKPLSPRAAKPFNKMVADDVGDDDDETNGDVTSSAPDWFRVWNGVLRIYPTPNEDDTATVYYFAKEPLISYSNANLTLTVRLREDYLESLLTYCKGLVHEIAGNEQMADKKKADAFAMLEEAKANKESYDFDTAVSYHGALD